jgi:hypothetical protein
VAAGLALAAAQPDWRRRISRLLARRDQLPRTRFRLRRGSALKQQDGFAKP